MPFRQLQLGLADLEARGADNLFAIGGQDHFRGLNVAAFAGDVHIDVEVPHRHRALQVDRETGHRHRPLARQILDDAGNQARRRTAVQHARVPGTRAMFRGNNKVIIPVKIRVQNVFLSNPASPTQFATAPALGAVNT
jgi:hypothetical protein